MIKKKLGLLLIKNLVVELRSYAKTLIEILAILTIFIILYQIKDHKKLKKPHYQKDINLNDLSQFKKVMFFKGSDVPFNLYYTPNNNYTRNIFKTTTEELKLSEAVGFDNENDMIEDFNASSTLAAVILKDNKVILRFPNFFRTRATKKFFGSQDFWLTKCDGVLTDDGENDTDFYIREGFLQLLFNILKNQVKGETDKEVSLRISSVYSGREANVNCVNDLNRKSHTPQGIFVWSLYYFLYLIPFLNLIWKLSREHEENIFVHHSIYGISFVSQRLAHFMISLLHFIILDTMIFILIKLLWPPLPASKSVFLFAFLILYNMLMILYAMTLASIIKNSKSAVWCGVTIWITSYAVFLEIFNTMSFDLMKPTFFLISLLFFNHLFPNGLMDYFEGENNKSLRDIMLFLALQYGMLLIYGCVFKYVECCYINKFRKRDTKKCKNKCLELKCKLNENFIEYGPLTGEILQLKNIYSCCDNFREKPQLKNISLRIFKNEISVLLGPHNSGKTKLIKLLAGWESFKGDFIYQGQNVAGNWSYYGPHVDVSLSNNPLFDLLTVQETLKYFVLLKGTHAFEFKTEQQKWLRILKPLINCKTLVKTLSFGEKRLVALCCTMVCSTPVILLDEPTVHMKSEEQNSYWNILKLEKKNRAIIVATSDVDEATEIADRLGILHNGCLMAWGTSFFLRTKCAGLFYLVCLIDNTKPVEPITELLRKYVQNLKIHNRFADRVIYTLPADKKENFQRLFIDLETNFSRLGITNFYITGSSLNDVYMNLTMTPGSKNQHLDIGNTLKYIQEKQNENNGKLVSALLFKKLLCQSKDLISICIIFIAFFLISAISRMPPAHLNVDSLTFSGRGVLKDSEHSALEIHDVADVKNGLFYYENVKYVNDVHDNRTWKNFNAMAGLEVKEPNVWFNRQNFHSAPLALNLAYNYLNNASIYINKPIELWNNYDTHLLFGIVIPLTNSMVFVKIQEERFSHMWTLQKITCFNDKTQWMVTFLWDISICFLNSILYLVILIVCVLNKTNCQMVMAATILLFFNGIASLFFIYLMSLFIMEGNKIRAYIKIFLIQLSLGLLPFVLYVHILEEYAEILFYVFLILPGFSVLHGTNKIFDNNEKLSFSSYFQWNNPGVLDSIVFISLTSFINFIIFVAIIVYRRAYLKSTPKRVKRYASVCYPYDDQRVVKEKVRISNMNMESCRAQAVLVDQLEHRLPKKGNNVNSISFALNKNTCFGLYGSNHSGKTHLLKQLVGEEGYWFGEVYIAGFNSKKQMENALKRVSYCPQNKGFNGLLTPSELFAFFLMMVGVKQSDHLDCLRHLSVSLRLRKYMNCRIKDLAENIKRRINVAVAIIACRQILILDEPTKGLPAFDRQLIWNIIKSLRNSGSTIIFSTSESLELRELSDLVVIVNEGEMLLYDNPHNMEYQYNIGFNLEIKLYADGLTLKEVKENLNSDVENLNRFVMFFHEESELLYRCDTVCQYFIPVENIIYSYIFGTIEKHRNRLNIADYNLGPFSSNRILKTLQKSRKAKMRPERARTNLLKDPKTLPKRY